MSGNVMAIGQKGKKMTDREDHEILDEWLGDIAPYSEVRDGMEPDIDGYWCRYHSVREAVLLKARALEAERDELQEVVRSIRFLRTVERERYEAERYKLLEALTPSADTSEFGMDVIAARAKLGETEK